MKRKNKLFFVSFLSLTLGMSIPVFADEESATSDSTRTEAVSENPAGNENGGGEAKTVGKIAFTTDEKPTKETTEKTVDSKKQTEKPESKKFYKALPKTGAANSSTINVILGSMMIWFALSNFKKKKGDA